MQAAVASLFLICLTESALAADLLLWLAEPQPEVMTAFSARWQQLRGAAPELITQAASIDSATTARVAALITIHEAPPADADASTGLHVVLRVPREQAPANRRQTGIYNEASPAAMLRLWQQLLPDRQPAGLLVGAANPRLWPYWQREAQRQHLMLRPGFVRAGEQAQRVFALTRPGFGVLLYSQQASNADPLALGVILRDSLASGLPVLGTVPALLPAGALAVLHQDDSALGDQAARVAFALLHGDNPLWQEPEPLQLALNHQVARSLQIDLQTGLTKATSPDHKNNLETPP